MYFNKQTFYMRCQACNRELDMFQQKRGGWSQGLCSECKEEVFYAQDPWHFDKPAFAIENELYRMMNPPMGDVDEFFQDVENQYQGGSYE